MMTSSSRASSNRMEWEKPNPSHMYASVQIKVNEQLYIKNPQESKLGKKIILNGIQLLDEIGLEAFTFKKLAVKMGSTEASIYRYFENKHLFLIYLMSWYWEWVNFRIDFNSMNVTEPKLRLRIVIKTIIDTVRLSTPAEYIDRDALNRIVITEGIKGYHSKKVDNENKQGFFSSYKNLNQKIANVLLENNPDFPYPHTLASNLVEMSHNHIYFAQHIPSLTDVRVKTKELKEMEDMLMFFACRVLAIEC